MSSPADPIYLDYNATTPVLPEVLGAMLPYLTGRFGNPSSLHSYGRQARAGVDKARDEVALLLGCSPDEIVFTSGGTESNNLAILGSARAMSGKGRIVTSIIEHPAASRPCEVLEREGWEVTRVSVDRLGVVNLDQIQEGLNGDPLLVTIMHANNETGCLQPIAQVAELVKERGALVHTDAAQSVGKIPVRVDDLHVDLLTVAGHKLYAPKGVGALYVRRGTRIESVITGAQHEYGLRPGTENVASIVGLGTACALARRTIAAESERVRALRDRLWARLKGEIPEIRLNGHPTERLPNTLNVLFPGVRGSALLDAAPAIAASTGSACHEGGETASGVLLAMGVDPTEGLGAIRLSLGRQSVDQDVTRAAEALISAWENTL